MTSTRTTRRPWASSVPSILILQIPPLSLFGVRSLDPRRFSADASKFWPNLLRIWYSMHGFVVQWYDTRLGPHLHWRSSSSGQFPVCDPGSIPGEPLLSLAFCQWVLRYLFFEVVFYTESSCRDPIREHISISSSLEFTDWMPNIKENYHHRYPHRSINMAEWLQLTAMNLSARIWY